MNKMNYGKRRITCGVCLEDGHNKRGCPNLESLYEEYEAVVNGTKTCTGHRKVWILRAAAFEMERRKNKKVKTPKRRKKPRCSFCRKQNHNRRNCPAFSRNRDKFMKANQNWKRKFVESFKESGYGVGGLVKVIRYRQWGGSRWIEGENVPAIIKSIPFDKLNFMCSFQGQYDYKTNVGIDLLATNGDNVTFLESSNIWHFATGERGIFKKPCFGDLLQPVEMLSPATPAIPEGWIEEDDDSIDWLLKNHSIEELENLGIMKLVNEWSKK